MFTLHFCFLNPTRIRGISQAVLQEPPNIVVVVVVEEFIHCNLKHEYFYGDYSIEWVKG